MSDDTKKELFSRRGFLEMGSTALAAAGMLAISNPPPVVNARLSPGFVNHPDESASFSAGPARRLAYPVSGANGSSFCRSLSSESE